MIFEKRIISFVLVFIFSTTIVYASLISEGAEQIVKFIIKKGSQESTQELIEFGGKEAIEKVLQKASQEGGQQLVEKIIKYGSKYGITAIKVIDNAPSLYVNALEQLPPNLIKRALWAAEREPKTVTYLIRSYGPEALEAVAKFRGIGSDIIAKLGSDGIEVLRELSEEQAVIFAKHLDEITNMPNNLKQKVLNTIKSIPKQAIDYLEKHPRILATVAGITTFIALKDEVLGSDESITTSNGNIVIRKKGLIERLIINFKTPISSILFIIAIIIASWGAIKIWSTYKSEKMKINYEKIKMESDIRTTQEDIESKNKQS